MDWKKEEHCNLTSQSKFIDIEKPVERKYIIQIISDEFPKIPRIRIAATVDKSIKHLLVPINRAAFLRFMQINL